MSASGRISAPFSRCVSPLFCLSMVRPWGWDSPGPNWAFPSRRKSGAGFFYPYTAEHETHRPIFGLIILCKFATWAWRKLLGGRIFCIGVWGVPALRALPFCPCVSQNYSTPSRPNTQEIFQRIATFSTCLLNVSKSKPFGKMGEQCIFQLYP